MVSDEETDVSRLKQVFKILKSVMINRNNMVEESMNEAKKRPTDLTPSAKTSLLFFSLSPWTENSGKA